MNEMSREAPTGMALYGRAFSKSRHGSPKQFAKLCADHGLSWFAIGGPWHDKNGERWINQPDTVKRYADALAAAGVAPHVWGYPWWDRIGKFVEDLDACMCDAIVGRLPDPELGLKEHPEAALDLVERLRYSSRYPYHVVGFTSYGLAKGHPTFPFDAFAKPDVFDFFGEVDYGSPQLYDETKPRIARGMREYAALGFDVVIPSFGLYKWVPKDPSKPLSTRNRKAVPMTPAELELHLRNFLPVQAMIGWAENFMTPELWRVLARWSDLIDKS